MCDIYRYIDTFMPTYTSHICYMYAISVMVI